MLLVAIPILITILPEMRSGSNNRLSTPYIGQVHLEATSDDATAVKALSATDADANRNIEERLRMLTIVQVQHA